MEGGNSIDLKILQKISLYIPFFTWGILHAWSTKWSRFTKHFHRWVQFCVMNLTSIFNPWFATIMLQYHPLTVRSKKLLDLSRDFARGCGGSFEIWFYLIPLISGQMDDIVKAFWVKSRLDELPKILSIFPKIIIQS
jgi:hypothetical protein